MDGRYEYVQLVSETDDELAALIRSCVNSQVHWLKLVPKSFTRSAEQEMMLHARASSTSEYVASFHHRGSSSAEVYFGITEHCATDLRSRITSGKGMPDGEFWRLSAQLVRGVRPAGVRPGRPAAVSASV